jgi:hypothetical protein
MTTHVPSFLFYRTAARDPIKQTTTTKATLDHSTEWTKTHVDKRKIPSEKSIVKLIMNITFQKSSFFLFVGILSVAALSAPAASTSSSSASLDSIWNGIPEGPPDAILGIAQAFRACQAPNKVNVCVGAYRDEQGQPWVLPSVREAETILLSGENKEYLPIEGDQAFVEKALTFAYGPDAPLERIAGVQTLSGTGACRIGGQFLSNFYPNRNIFVPDRKYQS